MNEKITTYKGVNKDLTAYGGFKYVPGEEYECAGKIVACGNGFHACERPLDVLSYYAPASSRYFEAEQSGELSRDHCDSKVASRKIKIGAEIGVPGLVKAHIEYVKAHTTMEHTDPDQATAGDRGAATTEISISASSVSMEKNRCRLIFFSLIPPSSKHQGIVRDDLHFLKGLLHKCCNHSDRFFFKHLVLLVIWNFSGVSLFSWPKDNFKDKVSEYKK